MVEAGMAGAVNTVANPLPPLSWMRLMGDVNANPHSEGQSREQS